MSLLYAAILALATQAPVQQRPPRDPAITSALARDPSTLPRGQAGRWSQWKPQDPISPQLAAAFSEGLRAYSAGDYGPALERLLQVLQREPDQPAALYQAGLAYFRLRRYRDCATLIERFEAVVPHEVGATQVLAHCYYSLGDYAKAREQYEQVLAAAPRSVEALRGYALTRMRQGELDAALEILRQVVALRPEHADAHAWIAQILYDLGRSEEALAAARRSRELDPFEPRAWFLESQALLDLGEEEQAAKVRERFEVLSRVTQQIRQLEGLMLHDPHQTELLTQLVVLQRSIGNVEAVHDLLGRLAAERPDDVELRIFALDVLEQLGDADGARAAALALEQRCANEWRAWKRLERYYASVRDRPRQVQAAERYLRLKGDQGE